MNSAITITRVVRFVARSLSLLIAAFVSFFMLSEVFGSGLNLENESWHTVLEFLLFPVSVTFGLLLGLKKELHGGIVTTVSIILLWVLRPDLAESNVFRLILLPGLLYLWLALGNRRQRVNA